MIAFTSEEPTRFGISCLGRYFWSFQWFPILHIIWHELIEEFHIFSMVYYGRPISRFLFRILSDTNCSSSFLFSILYIIWYELLQEVHVANLLTIKFCSRLLAGLPTIKVALEGAVDKDNVSFEEAAGQAGYEFALETLVEVPLKEDTYSAFIELHIEQGPILEEEGNIVLFIFLIWSLYQQGS